MLRTNITEAKRNYQAGFALPVLHKTERGRYMKNNVKVNEIVKIPTNHKCYKCIWANIESGKIFCFRKPCVREAEKNGN
jgi:hypothetical protein